MTDEFSGGWQMRIALAKLLLFRPTVLLLDEPTNHLDMRSKDVLKQALMQYDGTLILVSHDRDFLQGLTNRVFEFRGGNVKQHFGDVNEYLRDRKVGSFRQIEQEVKSNKAEGRSEESLNGKEKEEKKKKENQLNEIQNQITRHERRIEKLETEIKAIDEKLMHPEVYSEIVNNKETFATYEKLKKQLEEEMKKWEELQGELALL